MRTLTKIIMVWVFFFSVSSYSHQPSEGKVTTFIAPFLFRGNFGAGTPSFDSPWLLGGALVVEGDVDNNGGLEMALFYLNKHYFRQDNGLYSAERVKTAYITMGYRHWFNEDNSFAMAFFSAYPMGEAIVIHSDAPSGVLDTSARDATEYGFDLSYQREFWRNEKWAAAIDFRYSKSITTKNREDADHYGVMLGLKYQVREKGTPRSSSNQTSK